MSSHLNEIKLWLINVIILSFSFSNAEIILKVLSLIILIGYNLHKWYLLINKKDETK
jgi:hypothetical protein